MSESIIDPLSDGNANGSSRGSSLGLNSTGGDKEQQVVTCVPSPGAYSEGARFIYRGEIAQREWRYFLQPLHTTKDTQSKGAELHEPRTTVP